MITTLLLLCSFSSLFPCYTSWSRVKQRICESSVSLFLCVCLYAMCFIYGTSVRLIGIEKINGLTPMTCHVGCPPEVFDTMSEVMTCVLIVENIILGFIIMKCKRPITYSLTFLIVGLTTISTFATLITGMNPLANFFTACCGIMAYFAWVLELTYKEFCVIGNIYLQAGICLLSALAPLFLCIRQRCEIVQTSLCAANAIIHCLLFLVICIHYWMPLEESFDLCYHELNYLASITGSTYVMVNLIIFVIMFVGDLLINSLIFKLSK